MITTTNAAIDALQSALADVDNNLAAGRALGRVACQFRSPLNFFCGRTSTGTGCGERRAGRALTS